LHSQAVKLKGFTRYLLPNTSIDKKTLPSFLTVGYICLQRNLNIAAIPLRVMKIFPAELIRAIDQYTIENEPITSVALMERASTSVTAKIVELYPNREQEFAVFAGASKNGGDGLAIARQLAEQGYKVQAYFVQTTPQVAEDTQANLILLQQNGQVALAKLSPEEIIPFIETDVVIIDALFGTGVNRPLNDFNKHIVEYVNDSGCTVIAVDIPSGLMAEDNSSNDLDAIVCADYTITLETPKLALLLPENESFVGELAIVPIGLHPKALDGFPCNMQMVTSTMASKMLYKRRKFAHKGTFGHCYLIAGSQKMLGASLLSSKSCIKSGAGLLTTHIPQGCQIAFNITVPEVILDADNSNEHFTQFASLSEFDAIGIGPGLGTSSTNSSTFAQLLTDARRMPIIIDADALNMLSYNKELLKLLPKFAILTPHPKEFERLAGKWNSDTEKLLLTMKFAKEYSCYLVLKGAHTVVASPDGRLWFASVGNPGMATAGSGDVLTGIILSLLGQGYSPEEASILGVHIHGLAGDIAARNVGQEALTASDIIDNIGEAFKMLWNIRNS
jgi:NAD(P)H-hydrate epimerase